MDTARQDQILLIALTPVPRLNPVPVPTWDTTWHTRTLRTMRKPAGGVCRWLPDLDDLLLAHLNTEE